MHRRRRLTAVDECDGTLLGVQAGSVRVHGYGAGGAGGALEVRPRWGGASLSIEVDHRDDGVTVCRPIGELDAFTVSAFRQALAELADSPRLVIELSGSTFVDSAGLGALIGGIRRTRELGGVVAVACNRPTLTRLLRTTGFDRLMPVVETVEEAVAVLEPPGGDARRG
ncbi:MAG: STAS domain-containing protein [Actinomycetota bacterium]|nr:STAS domain-containing protein [Actinomycetota bacterium]